MFKKFRKLLSISLSLVLIATTSLGSFSKPVAASYDGDGTGVHADQSTFEKNFSLSVAQKKYCITQCIRTVNIVTDPTMSDLEKYYRLALWENDHATYDYDFWSGAYNFDYYRHQWDAYGVLTDTSVCAGIAIFYANLCHAADLPCKFVRTDPTQLDHTINYIPDINGNAYLVDVTEASFLMSELADYSFGDLLDKDFAFITKDCTDGSFEYEEVRDYPDDWDEGPYTFVVSSNIKQCFKGSYTDWFNEFALHTDESKNFRNEYVEKGSGMRNVHYASYKDYPKQFSSTEKPGIWFLEDFYKDPAEVEDLIRNRTLDEQLVSLEGLQDTYDCSTASELLDRLKYDLDYEVFPSFQDGEVTPEALSLCYGEDFLLKCTDFNLKGGEAEITMEGIGDYNGSTTFTVNLGPEDSENSDDDNNSSNDNSNSSTTYTDLTNALKALADAVNAQNSGQVTKLEKEVATLNKKLNNSSKKANSLKVKGKKVTISRKALKKKAKTLKINKAIKFINKGKGAKIYAKASGNKNITINSSNGKITVNKNLKKGTYKVKVKVIAAGNKYYNSSAWKTATFTVRVK